MVSGKKVLWLILLLAGLLTFPGSAGVLLAQGPGADLSLRMLPSYYHREISPGESTTLLMEIRNVGEENITDIIFDSDIPPGWTVEYQPGSIDNLGAGGVWAVDVLVTAPDSAAKGDYDLIFIAEASEARTATSIRLTVENGFSLWLWIGLGLTAVAVAGFYLVYRRFSK